VSDNRIRLSEPTRARLLALLEEYSAAVGSTQTVSQLLDAMITRLPSVSVLVGPPAEWLSQNGADRDTLSQNGAEQDRPGHAVPKRDTLSHSVPKRDTLSHSVPKRGRTGQQRKPTPPADESCGTDDATRAPTHTRALPVCLSVSYEEDQDQQQEQERDARGDQGNKDPIRIAEAIETIAEAWNRAAAGNSLLEPHPIPPPPAIERLLLVEWKRYPHLDIWLAAIDKVATTEPEIINRIGMHSLHAVLRHPGGREQDDCVLLKAGAGAYRQRQKTPPPPAKSGGWQPPRSLTPEEYAAQLSAETSTQ
jgi:hypothetical protein